MQSQQAGYSYREPLQEEHYGGAHVMASSYLLQHDFLDSQFQGIVAASDSKIYFGMSCHAPEHNGQFYSFDPQTETLRHINDLGAWCGETDSVGTINTHGKTHSNIYEADGILYFSTTSGHFTKDHPYNGGHFLGYELSTGECLDLAHYPDVNGGGLLTLVHDPLFGRLYAIHQRDCTLIYYDLESHEVVTLGTIQLGRQTRDLITDQYGNIYGAERGGVVFKYDAEADRMSCLLSRIPHDPDAPQPLEEELCGHTFWAQMRWDPRSEGWYGIRRNDEYLFRFRPPSTRRSHIAEFEGLAAIGYLPSTELQPRVGSLAMALGNGAIYYCSIRREWPAGRFVDELQHDLDSTVGVNLMSYDIESERVNNHGPVFTTGGRQVAQCHSMTLGNDGRLYMAAAVFSKEGEDPANSWQYAGRNGCHIHMRLAVVDPTTDLRT